MSLSPRLMIPKLYGDCIGQKYFHVFFGSSQDPSRIAEVIDGKAEEVESCVEDKKGRILEIKMRRVKNPDSSFSVIAIIRDVTERVRYERRIKNLSELHKLIGESVNRSYTIDQLCTIILKQLQEVIGFDMGDIQIYNPDTEMLFSYAQIGNSDEETSEVKDGKSKIAAEAIHRKETFFFDYTEKGTDAQTRLANNIQEVLAIPLKTKGEIHGALIIYTRTGRRLSKEDRTLLEGISEAIAGGIAKIKAEEEWRLKANALEIASRPIYMSNMGGKLTYVNPAFLELWGYDREGVVLGRPYTELWKGETENVVIMACAKGSREGDLIALRKDGSKFKARLVTSLIMGKNGPSQLVAVAEPEN